MLATAMGKRSDQGRGGLVRKTGTYRAGDEVRTYRYWQASREIPRELLGTGDSRRRVTGSGSTKAEAWRRCNANYDALLQGRARTGRRIRSAPMSVQELFDQWQAVNESGAVSAVMARKYRGYFENHILPYIGESRVDRLSEADLTVHFHRTLADKVHAETGKPLLSEASRRNIYSLEFAILSWWPDRHTVVNTACPECGRVTQKSHWLAIVDSAPSRVFEEGPEIFHYSPVGPDPKLMPDCSLFTGLPQD